MAQPIKLLVSITGLLDVDMTDYVDFIEGDVTPEAVANCIRDQILESPEIVDGILEKPFIATVMHADASIENDYNEMLVEQNAGDSPVFLGDDEAER